MRKLKKMINVFLKIYVILINLTNFFYIIKLNKYILYLKPKKYLSWFRLQIERRKLILMNK